MSIISLAVKHDYRETNWKMYMYKRYKTFVANIRLLLKTWCIEYI